MERLIMNILERRNINYYGSEVEKKATFSGNFKKTSVARLLHECGVGWEQARAE